MNKELLENIQNLYSVSDQVAGLIIKLKNRFIKKIIQVYAPTSAYNDKDVEEIYDIESSFGTAQNSVFFYSR